VEWSEELSAGLLQAAPDAILVMDGGRIVLANDRAAEMFGGPLLELPARELLTEDAFAAYPDQLQRRLTDPEAGAMGTLSTEARRRSGEVFPVEASLATVDTAEGRLIVAVVRDLTERRRAEQEQADLRLEAQAHRNQRLESLGQLAGGIAHDFNNLLGVILNYANFVVEEAESAAPAAAAIAADARQVIKAGERGTELTRQLLAFARKEVVRPQLLDLNAVLAGVEQLLRRTLGAYIRLTVQPAADLPAVNCDPGQIEQLLVTLALNARDAMPAGGQLAIDTAPFEAGKFVRLRVSDSGSGMPADVVERAFEPFFTTKGVNGTGLGLAEVYGIARRHRGRAEIESTLGVGTTVRLMFPPASPGAASSVDARNARPPRRVLLVEDHIDSREFMQSLLESDGHSVEAVRTVAEGRRRLADVEHPIDVLVTDIGLPDGSGWDLVAFARDVRPSLRIGVVTGWEPRNEQDPACDFTLRKPVGATELLGQIAGEG
jgi:two-component system, cell cycle sensor histidine kinase and response regulator CckA